MFVDQVWFIILTNGLIAFFTGVYNPSRQAVINEIVPQKNINQANSLFGSTMAILHLAGPFIGASFYAYFKGVQEVLLLDLFAFLVGLFLLSRMNYTPLKDEDADLSQAPLTFLGNLKEGFNYIIKRRDLRALLINASVAGLCIGVLVPLLLPFVTEVLGQGEREYGLLLSLFGLGGLFGGLAANRLCENFKTGRVVVILLCLEPMAMLMWINSQALILNYIVIAFWGLLVFARIPSQLNYISETVETRYLTRVHSLLDMAFVVPNISGGIVVAFFGGQFSTYAILAVVTAVFISLTYPRLLTRDMRTLFASNAKKVVRSQ
jgi:MFS family permease